MKTKKPTFWPLLPVAVLVVGSAACTYAIGPDGDLPQRLWCGNELCTWSVEEGKAHPSPTWHELDPEVRLAGSTVRLSRVDKVPSTGKLCALFEVRLNAPAGTSVRLEVDLGDDGTVELSEPMSEGVNLSRISWWSQSLRSPHDAREIPGLAQAGQAVRAAFVKEGPADAILYPLQVSFQACPTPSADASP